ncbi:MAG: hypothetical protein LM556_01320 [Desulfurococcaceae archaeon]|nr:hypothetical protein [Desulfurococcaceae archaeon]
MTNTDSVSGENPFPIPELIIRNTIIIVSIIVVVIVLRIIITRALRALVEKGVLSTRGLEIIARLIDLIAFFITASIVILLFSPQFWIVLALLGVLAFIVYIVLFDVIRPYIAGLAIQINPVFKSRSLDIILPEHNSAISGRLVKIDAQYLVIQDVFGNEYYIRNDAALNSIIKITPIYIQLIVEVNYKCSTRSLVDNVNSIIRALETARIPLFKEEVKVSLLEMSSTGVKLGLRLYPVSTPIRQTDLLKAVSAIIETIKSLSEENCIMEDVTVKVPVGL